MPGMMYLPPEQRGGQTNQVMNLIAQLALMKVAQNFREKEAAIEDLRATTREQTRTKTAAAMEGWRPAEGEEVRAPGAGAVEIGGAKMMPPVAPVLTPEQSQDIGVIPTGVPGKYHFYKKDPEAEFLRTHNLLRVGTKLFQMDNSDPTKLRQIGGKDITFLRPTTDDAGNVLYPAVTETGEPSPQHNLVLPKAGKATKLEKTKEAPEYTPQQKMDDVRAFFNSRRQAIATTAPTYDKDKLQPAFDVIDKHERAELWRAMNKQPTALELGKQVDEFGFFPGERRVVDGKAYEYKGQDHWAPVGQEAVTGVRTPRPRGYR